MSNSKSASAALALPVQPLSFMPASRAKAAPVAKAVARPKAAAAPAGFAELMELGLTTLIFAAVFLFAAGLLHYSVPACQARQVGVLVLDGCGAALSAMTAFVVTRGLVRLAR